MDIEGRNLFVLGIEHTSYAIHPIIKLIGVNDLGIMIVAAILIVEVSVLLGFLIKIGIGIYSVFGSCRYPTLLDRICINTNIVDRIGIALRGGVEVDSGCKKILSVLCAE